jgi:hypothetical protein
LRLCRSPVRVSLAQYSRLGRDNDSAFRDLGFTKADSSRAECSLLDPRHSGWLMVNVASRTFMVRTEKLLRDEKLGVIVVRLMIVMNDISITNSSMQEWQTTTEPKKRGRWRGGVLYFGRIQSAHLFEALSIIKEIRDDTELRAVVARCDTSTQQSFATVLPFLSGTDFGLMACPSSDNLRLIRLFAKGGSGSSGVRV